MTAERIIWLTGIACLSLIVLRGSRAPSNLAGGTMVLSSTPRPT